jgi:hypothetical protein
MLSKLHIFKAAAAVLQTWTYFWQVYVHIRSSYIDYTSQPYIYIKHLHDSKDLLANWRVLLI